MWYPATNLVKYPVLQEAVYMMMSGNPMGSTIDFEDKDVKDHLNMLNLTLLTMIGSHSVSKNILFIIV